MKRLSSLSFKALLVVVSLMFFSMPLTTPHAASPAAAQDLTPAKVEEFLRQSGYNYRKTSETSWVIDREGKNLPKFNVIVALAPGLLLAGVPIARKSEMRMTSELTLKLLRRVHNIDYVKIGLDSDEDLFVREELRARLIDQQVFKEMIEDVSIAANAIYGEIKPLLKRP